MSTIVQKGNPVLKKVAAEVPLETITGKEIQDLLSKMKVALDAEHDGVGLAAPQIGVSLRVFIVSEKAYRVTTIDKRLVFINPVLKKLSKEKKILQEGCLSVRPWYGETERSVKATVEAYDETGKKFTKGGSGLLAQIFQHEVDHLNGILFDDHAKNLLQLDEEGQRKYKEEQGERKE